MNIIKKPTLKTPWRNGRRLYGKTSTMTESALNAPNEVSKGSNPLGVTMEKTLYSFRLDSELGRQLKIESLQQNRSMSNYVETLLSSHPARGGFKAKKPSTKRSKKDEF